jgi:hypothetical protein|tara:strand:+ start:340 stop:639 length:300 start_codon:yes stop_codon:yes gene_type:complete
MPFSKNFPKTIKGSNYPRWEEVFLTDDEEKLEEAKCRQENIALMDECITDAKIIISKQDLKPFQNDLMRLAISLFEKRASHAVYWKESKAKEKFDNGNK